MGNSPFKAIANLELRVIAFSKNVGWQQVPCAGPDET